MALGALADGALVASVEGAVGRILFNRPEKHNAMSLAMWAALSDALGTLADDESVRVVVLSGAGDRAFVSGADISEFDTVRAGNSVAHYNAVSEGADRALFDFPKPTIAMIRGVCVGGGMGLALACDIRIASVGSRLGITAARLGLGYGLSGVRKLVDAVGPATAAEVLYSATLYDAPDALAMRLVNRVVAADDLVGETEALAAAIAANAPLTLRAAKAAIRAAARPEQDASDVRTLVERCFASQDYAEGRRAFAERRRPEFRGR